MAKRFKGSLQDVNVLVDYDIFIGPYILKLIKLSILTMCSLLRISYISNIHADMLKSDMNCESYCSKPIRVMMYEIIRTQEKAQISQ